MTPKHIIVFGDILTGEALPGMIEGHVVCASFNAG